MFNKEKSITEEQLQCPWTSNYGFAIDYTFASRLFNFLAKMYKNASTLPPGYEEEYEYLLKSASKLKIWQMGVPNKLNENYFNNLKNIKIDPNLIKYLSNINCSNAFDVDKYLIKQSNDDKVQHRYDQAYIAVNENGECRVFEGIPSRHEEKIMIEDTTKWEEDHYGKDHHPYVWNGKFNKYWYSVNGRGAHVNKECLPAAYQNMSWEDEPKAM